MSAVLTAVVVVAAIAAATVALCLGHLDGESFAGLVSAALGLGAGAGIHQAGVSSAATIGAGKSGGT